MKIKLNDQVQVITGKDKGKKGKVIKVLRKQDAVVVEKVNLHTKYIKKRENKAGEKIQLESKIHVSNVMIICPKCNKAVRLGYRKLDNNKKKQRICKKCKEAI